MKIKQVKVLRGPNYWSIRRTKLIQMLLDLEELEWKPSNKIPGFYERIQQLLPSLYDHQCSEGHQGGFFERVKDGTWMGHIIEHIALELQSLAGMPTDFGRTRSTGQEGLYYVVFSYAEESAGLYAGKQAVACAEALIKGEPFDVDQTVSELKRLWVAERLGPSTGSIVEEAAKRNIPHIRLDDCTLVQLGYGCKQKRIDATMTANTNAIGVDIAANKDLTKKLLRDCGVPVSEGEVISDVENLRDVIDSIDYPVVVKPLDGNHGKGATVGINNWHHAFTAFERAKKFSKKIIVEKLIHGKDYRILMINKKFIAASLRTPAAVKGDGRNTIQQLIDMVNNDPRRGNDHDEVLTKITVDEVTLELLKSKRYTLDTILPLGEKCILKPTANLSTGGTSKDVTDEVHPSNILLFERIARTIGLDVCGIDIIAPNLSVPLKENGGAVLEVNAAPGFRMHLQPTAGEARNVAAPVVDMLFNDNGRIPIVAITGTNGKTTTTRLVAHIAKQAGYQTGLTTTDGIYINGELISKGDCSGPGSAQTILRDPSVEFAVLETARGGILRSGLGFDQCSTAIITNVAEDHLGLDGIDTLEKLAKVKSIVAEAVCKTGYAILNADDDLVYAMKDKLDCKIALFSLYPDSVRIEEHCKRGGLAAVYENDMVMIRIGHHYIPIEEVKHIPISFDGKCEFNIANVLAALLAAYTNDIRPGHIRQALKSFMPSGETTPGRLNMFEFSNFSVMIDYAHNPHGVRALGKFIKTFNVTKRVGIIAGVGDRRDEDIMNLGEEAAKVFDEIIIRHDKDMRGRSVEEVERLILKGITKVDGDKPVLCSMDEYESLKFAIEKSTAGSLIVVLCEDISKATALVKEYQQKENLTVRKAV